LVLRIIGEKNMEILEILFCDILKPGIEMIIGLIIFGILFCDK